MYNKNPVKKSSILTTIGWVVVAAIAVTGWLFGALQSANAQTHTVLEKRIDKVESAVISLSIDSAIQQTTLDIIKSDVKEIKELLKKGR